MGAVYKKELKSYFTTMTGYVSIALILFMTGFFVKQICLTSQYPTLEQTLFYTSLILMLAVPILAMRSFSEEKRQKTDLLLYSLPLSTTQIVMGKYLSILTVLAVPTAIISFYPLVLTMYGTVDLVTTYASILALFMLASAMAAICMFMSSLTESQVIAAVLGVTTLLILYASSLVSDAVSGTAAASFTVFTVITTFIGFAVYLFVRSYAVAVASAAVIEGILLVLYLVKESLFEGLFSKAVSAISIFERFYIFVDYRIIDFTGYIYFASVAFLFVFLTVQMAEKRRYS